MKKIIFILLVIILILSNIAIANGGYNKNGLPKQPSFYGNVYMWTDNPIFVWNLMNANFPKGQWIEFGDKTTALINKGYVIEIGITAPYYHSFIRIYYKGHIYWFALKPHLIGYNFIMFTFEGGG